MRTVIHMNSATRKRIVSAALAASLCAIVLVSRSPRMPARGSMSAVAKQRIVTAYGKLPLVFEANRGQSNEQVKFLSRASGHTVFLTATETVLSTDKPESPVRMKLLAADPA